jgi:heterodisulfide reductase subunit A
MQIPDEATEKAKVLVKMGIEKAALLEPLEEGVSPVIHKALVIGGGGAGMTAALQLADAGFTTFLVEKEAELGGQMRHIFRTIEGADVRAYLGELETRVREHPNIELFCSSTVENVDGYIGKYTTTIRRSSPSSPLRGEDQGGGDATVTIDHGVIIVAIGGVEYQPEEGEYGWGSPRVISQVELERRLAEDPASLKGVNSVVMVQCVGSRNDEHPYCSKICCGVAVKNALALKRAKPESLG